MTIFQNRTTVKGNINLHLWSFILPSLLCLLCSTTMAQQRNKAHKSISTPSTEVTPGKMIDLGLSVKWAGYNLGAENPEEYGNLYDWTEANQSIANENANNIVRSQWGEGWQLPTLNETIELFDKCKHKQAVYKGVKGLLFTGPNGNSIFLPAAGNREATKTVGKGIDGNYWTSNADTHNETLAYDLYFHQGEAHWGTHKRNIGCSVRLVTK